MEEVAAGARRSGWRRAAFIAAFAAFVGVWAYAFWYDTHRPKPEPLDAVSVQAANAACRSAVVALSAIPPVGAAPTVADRIRRVHREDAVLTVLVARLDAIHPTDRSGATALADFTADWQHLTASRERYTAVLLTSRKRPQLVIPVDPTGAPITIRMGEYADIHKLTYCSPTSLQGEVVDGPRTYPHVS
jgi:hypothetical protein